MSDAQWYAILPDARLRSRSRDLESSKSLHFQNLISSLPFTNGARK